MNTIDERMKKFKESLSKVEVDQKQVKAELMQTLQTIYRQTPATLHNTPIKLNDLDRLKLRIQGPRSIQIQAQVDLSGDGRLKALDQQFIRIFELDRYLKTEQLDYPIVYCHTLEEFFKPITLMEALSQTAKNELLKNLVRRAEQEAAKGGIYGFNLPGNGCYLNGWLFAHRYYGITPQQILEKPEYLNKVLETAVHEKIGHGFLDVFSSLGQVNSALGSYQMRLAEQFGLQTSADPIDRVRLEQYNVLMANFILLQEGWATWIETFFSEHVFLDGSHPRHKIQAIIAAIEGIPADSEEQKQARQTILNAVGMILDDQFYPMEDLMQAVNLIHHINLLLHNYFNDTLGQPLCYALGEMMMWKAEINLGIRCVPVAGLIAANISFDPERISLSDMRELFESSPDLNPDARFVLISKLKLTEPDNIFELAEQAENTLSLPVPAFLKAKLSYKKGDLT